MSIFHETDKLQFPLKEQIGHPDLLVGREQEFKLFSKWLNYIPRELAESRVILARRKSGKTAIMQRIFNYLWSMNGEVIPFFFEVKEIKIWHYHLAINYYRSFASQYISFVERDENLVSKPLSLKEIKEYGLSKSIKFFVEDVDSFSVDKEMGLYDSIWETAYEAPRRFAAIYDKRFLVMIDEFQNLASYVYREEKCERALDETIPGSYHYASESKVAPMLVTGSYVGFLVEIMDKYLEAGRLKRTRINPYLSPEEGLESVYLYAEYYNEPITNETANIVNQLCLSDPFFIACVIRSDFSGKDLTTEDGVVNTVNYEIANRESRMSGTWREYIEMTLDRINDTNARELLLHLSKYPEREWTPKELKEALNMDLSLKDIQRNLLMMADADLIRQGVADIQFHGLRDGTLNLILRNRYEMEISTFVPDFKKEFHEEIQKLKKDKKRLQGMLNKISGQMAEIQLAYAFRTRKRFTISDFFEGISDNTKLNLINVKHRVLFQRDNGKNMEFDVIAESNCGRIIAVEVKKTQNKTDQKTVEDFADKVKAYSQNHPEKTILPCFLSLGGFTEDAHIFCNQRKIGTSDTIHYFY